jgi:hypothetical protein
MRSLVLDLRPVRQLVCEGGETDTDDASTTTWESPSASRRFSAPDGRNYVLPTGPDPSPRRVWQLLTRSALPVAIYDSGNVEWLEGDARRAAWSARIEGKLDAVVWPLDCGSWFRPFQLASAFHPSAVG